MSLPLTYTSSEFVDAAKNVLAPKLDDSSSQLVKDTLVKKTSMKHEHTHKKLDGNKVIHEYSYPNDKIYAPFELRNAYQSTPVEPSKDKRKVIVTIVMGSPISAVFLQQSLDGFCKVYDLPFTTLEVVPMPTISQNYIDFFDKLVIAPLQGYLNSDLYKTTNMFNEADFLYYFKNVLLSDYSSSSPYFQLIEEMLVLYLEQVFSSVIETLLDIQWSYAMNPYAKIRVVQSESMDNIFSAVAFASNASNFAGVGTDIISMSWGCKESRLTKPEVDNLELNFSNDKICYLASTGDTSDFVGYPSSSPNVLSVGGTSLYYNPFSDAMSQTTWYWDSSNGLSGATGAGCGYSTHVDKPLYQSRVIFGEKRCIPDICGVADPNTGVAIVFAGDGVNRKNLKYMILGGTSLSCPLNAGMLSNVIQSFINHNSAMVLTTVNNPVTANSLNLQTIFYDVYNSSVAIEYGLYSKCFYDVKLGSNGEFVTTNGYDVPTGLGSLYYDKFIDLFFDFAALNKLKFTTDQKNIIKRLKMASLKKYLNSM